MVVVNITIIINIVVVISVCNFLVVTFFNIVTSDGCFLLVGLVSLLLLGLFY